MSSEQLFLVAWDIRCDRRRTAVRKVTALFAAGGQKSAYECWLTPDQRDRLCLKLERLIDCNEDRLLILRLDPRWPVNCLGCAVPPGLADIVFIG